MLLRVGHSKLAQSSQTATAVLDIARSQLMARAAEAALDGSRSGHIVRTPGGAGAPLLTDSLRIGPAPARIPPVALAAQGTATASVPAALAGSGPHLDPSADDHEYVAAKATAAAALWRSRLEAGRRAWAADRRELEVRFDDGEEDMCSADTL